MTTKEWIDQLQMLIDHARKVDQLPEARRETLDELDFALDGLRHNVLMPRQLRTEVLSLEAIRENLLELAGSSGWPVLALGYEGVGGSQAAWGTLIDSAPEDTLRRVHDAAWDTWVEDAIPPSHEKAARLWFGLDGSKK